MTTRATHFWAVALTGAALFMITLDNLIVVSTLPSMQRDLGVSIDRLQWVVDAYILVFAVLILTGAALGDRYGRRRMLVAGLLVFTASSAAGALSANLTQLVVARSVGPRRGAAHAAHADAALGRLPARAPHRRARSVVVDRRPRRRTRAAARRRPRQVARLALDLLDQRPGRPRRRRCSCPAA